jgi:hypothetical protein
VRDANIEEPRMSTTTFHRSILSLAVAALAGCGPPSAPPAKQTGRPGGCDFNRGTPTSYVNFNGDSLGLYNTGEANSSDYATNQGGPTLSGWSLQLIYWGSGWNSASYPTANDITNSVQRLLNSTYLDAMSQYVSPKVPLRGVTMVTSSDPPASFSSDDLTNFLWNVIDTGAFPEPDGDGGNILYAILPMPGTNGPTTECGSHIHKQSYEFPADVDDLYYFYVDYGTLDSVTKEISHELVEALSDPGSPDGWVLERNFESGNPTNEIGDACNNNGDYVDGVYVQPYWSQVHRSCVIPFAPPPTVNFVEPTMDKPTGGAQITISGTNFDTTGNTQVWFGATRAAVISCPNSTTCTAIAPPGNGTVDVRVVVNNFMSATSSGDLFGWVPSVTGLSEQSGFAGDTLTIHGLGLLPGSTVNFGPYPATSVNCNPGPDCVVTVPAGSGTVDVQVTYAGATSTAWSGDQFAYGTPIVTGLSLSTGPMSGGTRVDFYGGGFDVNAYQDGSTTVYFEGVAAPWVQCFSNTWCWTETPAVPTAGKAHLVVDVYGTKSAKTPANEFTFNPYPLITTFVWASPQIGIGFDGNAPAGGAAVSLTSSDPTVVVVPSTVTVPAGTNWLDFTPRINPSPNAETVTVTATYQTSTASLTIQTSAWAPLTLDLGATSLDYGASSTATVWLDHPAGAGGAVVSLTSSDPSAVPVPVSVTIPGGHYKTTFPITNDYNGISESVTVTASHNAATASASVQVPPRTLGGGGGGPGGNCGVIKCM